MMKATCLAVAFVLVIIGALAYRTWSINKKLTRLDDIDGVELRFDQEGKTASWFRKQKVLSAQLFFDECEDTLSLADLKLLRDVEVFVIGGARIKPETIRRVLSFDKTKSLLLTSAAKLRFTMAEVSRFQQLENLESFSIADMPSNVFASEITFNSKTSSINFVDSDISLETVKKILERNQSIAVFKAYKCPELGDQELANLRRFFPKVEFDIRFGKEYLQNLKNEKKD